MVSTSTRGVVRLRVDRAASRLDAVQVGHADVHQDHVRAQRARPVERSWPSPASPTTSMSGSASRIVPQAGADERLVVGDDDADQSALRR